MRKQRRILQVVAVHAFRRGDQIRISFGAMTGSDVCGGLCVEVLDFTLRLDEVLTSHGYSSERRGVLRIHGAAASGGNGGQVNER